ncbi:hypothetical protein FGRMN_9580 [Fusarium graminum]|nr:hypothetical protein FGRMN_9580 [Fusarium graminum]
MSRAPSGQLDVFRGIRESLGTPSSVDQTADTNLVIRFKPTQQLFPSNAVRSRMRESNATRELNLSQDASVKAGSGTDDYEKSSIGTWNSPQERELSPPVEVLGAPLPAPLHIIQAISTTSTAQQHPQFSTASLALSGYPLFPDDQGFEQAGNDLDPSRDSDVREIAVAAVQDWETDKENYPVFDMQQNRRDPSTDDCDIDTVTGKLIPPVRYIKLQRDGKEQPHIRRRMDLTSGGHITREITRRQTLKEEIQRREQEAQYAKQAIVEAEEEIWPNAGCTLRPVATKDFHHIAEIINLEMNQGQDSQIFLSKVEAAHIATLYNACLAKHRPFIVAVPSPGQIPNRAGWSKAEEDEYQEFLKFKQARNASQSHNILGFAFIADSRQGFLGGACPGSRFTGQIRLVVHPSHRRKLIGTALLDRILMCASIYHRSLIDYTWDCSETRRTYEYVSAHNQQKYNKLYLETFLIRREEGEGEDPRTAGISWLLEKFDFERVAHFKDAVKHGNQPGIWKDLVVWELETRLTSEIVED